jgi:hypothetical protein
MSKKIILICAATAMLGGCGSTGLFNRDRPDEFAVSRQAPLVVPPDYSLKPPAPGTARPQDGNTQEQVLDALFGGTAPRSAAEKAVISAAGPSDQAIRSQVGDPGTNVVNKGSLTRDILSAPQGDGQNAQAAVGG